MKAADEANPAFQPPSSAMPDREDLAARAPRGKYPVERVLGLLIRPGGSGESDAQRKKGSITS